MTLSALNALEYVAFADRFGIPRDDVYVLPALFENAAQKASMPVRALLSQATYSNQKLGEYLASLAQTVAKQMREAA